MDASDDGIDSATLIASYVEDVDREFKARIDADIARWQPVIEAANIKIN